MTTTFLSEGFQKRGLKPRYIEYEYDLEHGVRFGVRGRAQESFITSGSGSDFPSNAHCQ
uniref:Uncharacterized protein n=1 Tax=Magallana gigas TaxID=29159 RepID=K1QUA8_MAGGI